jgi:hypothetical protein
MWKETAAVQCDAHSGILLEGLRKTIIDSQVVKWPDNKETSKFTVEEDFVMTTVNQWVSLKFSTFQKVKL